MDSGVFDSPVTLVIKAPNQKYDDQTINCFLNWTVERLKSHISNVYPSKPVSNSVFSVASVLASLSLKRLMEQVLYTCCDILMDRELDAVWPFSRV